MFRFMRNIQNQQIWRFMVLTGQKGEEDNLKSTRN